MKIAFVYNLKQNRVDFNQPEAEFQAEFDTPKTIEAITNAIRKNDFEVLPLEANEDLYQKLRSERSSIDFIFNFAEAITDSADREAHVPMIAEILKIPYSGPSPMSAALILNKYRTKEIWHYYKIPTPGWQVFEDENERLNDDLTFPLIVKANGQGSSAGIRNNSVVRNENELRERVRESISKFKEPALVERFLEGREFTVPVLGNGNDLEVLPIVESDFSGLPAEMEKIDSYEVKWIHDMPNNPNRVDSTICPAVVDGQLKEVIEMLAKMAFKTIECRDWSRVDMRMDLEGKLYVLEINCPVGLLPPPDESKLVVSAMAAGINYDEIIGKIIKIGLKRYGKI